MSATGTPGSLPPLRGAPLAIGAFGVSLASFMNVLDTTITNVSLSAISGNLGASPSQATWVITSYTMATAITVLLSGWISQRIGQVRLIVLSVLLFAVTSLCCALSPTLEVLIFFRLLQGLGSGPMVSMAQPLLMQIFPAAKVGVALAVWTSTILIAPVVGPLVGGYLTDNFSWHWIFYINVPIGGLAIWMITTTFRKRESVRRKTPIDFVGLVLTVTWVAALQVVADKGRELDWLNSSFIVALLVLAVVAFCFFLIWELTDPHPVVDLSLFKSRNFAVAGILLAVSYATFFGSNILLPLWLLQYQGYTALTAAIVLIPTGLVGFLAMPLVGRVIHRGDPRVYLTASFLIIALHFHMRASLASNADMLTLALPLILLGIGLSIYNIPVIMISLSGLPGHKVANASAIINFMRYFLAALAASLMTTLWDQRSALHHSRLVEGVVPGAGAASDWMQALAQGGLSQSQALAVIERTTAIESAVLGADEIYWVASLILLASAGLIWLSRPKPAGGTPGEQPIPVVD